MIADMSIRNVEEIQIGPVRVDEQCNTAHREIQIHTKQGVITLTLWGRCNPIDESDTSINIKI
jgi:hypothetical protein